MSEKEPQSPEDQDAISAFVRSACAGDIEALRVQVSDGFNVNGINEFNETILETLIGELAFFPETPRYEVIKQMLQLGADAGRLGPEENGPLFAAVLNMDTEMVRILLDAGADPNAVKMDSESESLYDWAEFDYRYEVWDINPPENATADDKADEDSWLRYLSRVALKYGKRPPDHLQLLRDRGAMTMSELRVRGDREVR